MNYTTLTFLFFLLITGAAYYALPKKLQWPVLFTASAGFFVLWCGRLVWMPAAAAFAAYGAALYMDRLEASFGKNAESADREKRKALKKRKNRKKKIVTVLSVSLVIAMLAGTKYCGFLGEAVNALAEVFGAGSPAPVLSITAPLGISYYSLMAVSYIADVYRGTVKAEKNPLMVMLFLIYFPHIVEGPFDRYGDLAGRFREPHRLDYGNIRDGGISFVWGLFKKFVIADRAALFVNPVFTDPAAFGGTALAAAMILFTIQIYAEFSGCMDMVRGVSRMFGISVAKNFRQPFFAVSIEDFWRRWHITLGQWLRDYVFYPVSLSGAARRLSRLNIAILPATYSLFFVWLCNGIWHGAGVKYIFYGLYYYILMMAGRMARPALDRALSYLGIDRESRGSHLFSMFRTWVIVCFGMLIFRADSLLSAWDMFAGMWTRLLYRPFPEGDVFSGAGPEDAVVLLMSCLLLLAVSIWEERGNSALETLRNRVITVRWPVYMALIFSVIILGVYGGDNSNMALIYAEF